MNFYKIIIMNIKRANKRWKDIFHTFLNRWNLFDFLLANATSYEFLLTGDDRISNDSWMQSNASFESGWGFLSLKKRRRKKILM